MAVAMGDHDMCAHCKEDLFFGNREGGMGPWRYLQWLHTETQNAKCSGGDRKAKPVHWCDERIQREEVCNRPVKEFGKCGIHSKDARIAYEREQRIDQLIEQDKYVEDTLGTLIEYWNTAYDLDAKLDQPEDWREYNYRSGTPKYTGYVLVNPARLADLMKKIEEEF